MLRTGDVAKVGSSLRLEDSRFRRRVRTRQMANKMTPSPSLERPTTPTSSARRVSDPNASAWSDFVDRRADASILHTAEMYRVCDRTRPHRPACDRPIEVRGRRRPFLGVSPSAPRQAANLLRKEGYIIEVRDRPERYAHYLAEADVVGNDLRPLLAELDRRRGRWFVSPGGPTEFAALTPSRAISMRSRSETTPFVSWAGEVSARKRPTRARKILDLGGRSTYA